MDGFFNTHFLMLFGTLKLFYQEYVKLFYKSEKKCTSSAYPPELYNMYVFYTLSNTVSDDII